MDVIQAIRGRRATRSYRPEAVGKETIAELIDAAICAPSGLNRQPWSFAVLQGQERLMMLEDAVRSSWRGEGPGAAALAQQPQEVIDHVNELLDSGFSIFHGAPVVVVLLAPADDPTALLDTALAGQNFMLAAHAKGLATCPVGLALAYFQDPETLAALGIPTDQRVVLPIVLGLPAGPSPTMPARRQPTVYWC